MLGLSVDNVFIMPHRQNQIERRRESLRRDNPRVCMSSSCVVLKRLIFIGNYSSEIQLVIKSVKESYLD